jgi:hypothetical protein
VQPLPNLKEPVSFVRSRGPVPVEPRCHSGLRSPCVCALGLAGRDFPLQARRFRCCFSPTRARVLHPQPVGFLLRVIFLPPTVRVSSLVWICASDSSVSVRSRSLVSIQSRNRFLLVGRGRAPVQSSPVSARSVCCPKVLIGFSFLD